jgi:hypothetical protein
MPSGSGCSSGVVTVAVVSNPLTTNQVIPLTRSNFEKLYPGIKVNFATYTEGDLRAAIQKDVSTHSNAFNVIMIGPQLTRMTVLPAGGAPVLARRPGMSASFTVVIGGGVQRPDIISSARRASSPGVMPTLKLIPVTFAAPYRTGSGRSPSGCPRSDRVDHASQWDGIRMRARRYRCPQQFVSDHIDAHLQKLA